VVDGGKISALGHASELLPTLPADIEITTIRMR
jgi:guanine deaminase